MARKFISRQLLGVAGYVIAEPFIDGLVGQFGLGIPADLLELGLGYFLKGRKGIIGAIGNAMFVINLYQLIKSLVAGRLLSAVSGGGTEGW